MLNNRILITVIVAKHRPILFLTTDDFTTWSALRFNISISPRLGAPVCAYYCSLIIKLFAPACWGGIVEDMRYEKRRAEACVDYSAPSRTNERGVARRGGLTGVACRFWRFWEVPDPGIGFRPALVNPQIAPFQKRRCKSYQVEIFRDEPTAFDASRFHFFKYNMVSHG
jgi:hypothetical protein